MPDPFNFTDYPDLRGPQPETLIKECAAALATNMHCAVTAFDLAAGNDILIEALFQVLAERMCSAPIVVAMVAGHGATLAVSAGRPN